jgi:hypothetical protein
VEEPKRAKNVTDGNVEGIVFNSNNIAVIRISRPFGITMM